MELDNALVTKESNIFKGNNRYVMCKNCGYIMAHNTRTNNIFGLERFQDDEEVLDDIQALISEVSNDYELIRDNDEDRPVCSGNCDSCAGCQEEVEEVAPEKPKLIIKEDSLLAINKQTMEASVLSPDSLSQLDLDMYDFYALDPVIIKQIVTYQVHRL
jgi:hypothetical protein